MTARPAASAAPLLEDPRRSQAPQARQRTQRYPESLSCRPPLARLTRQYWICERSRCDHGRRNTAWSGAALESESGKRKLKAECRGFWAAAAAVSVPSRPAALAVPPAADLRPTR